MKYRRLGQTEYSLWTRDIETSRTLAACRQLGISIGVYLPLDCGFLIGAFEKPEDLAANEERHYYLRMQSAIFA